MHNRMFQNPVTLYLEKQRCDRKPCLHLFQIMQSLQTDIVFFYKSEFLYSPPPQPHFNHWSFVLIIVKIIEIIVYNLQGFAYTNVVNIFYCIFIPPPLWGWGV